MSDAVLETPQDFVLAEFTPYRIVALGHAIGRRLSELYRGEDLSISEWRVLAVIGQAREMAARDVVQRTPMDKMAVSRAVASLEKKGFVTRRENTLDRRLSMLRLSAAGSELFTRVAAAATAYERELLEGLGDEAAAQFRNLMSRLEALVNPALDEAQAR